MDIKLIIWGIFISLVGWAYYRFGKKTGRNTARYVGFALMVLPYFIGETYLLLLLSCLLMAIPFIIKS